MDDATLARRCAARDEDAWRELLRRTGPAAEGVMRRVFQRAGVPDPRAEAAEAMGGLAATLLEGDAKILKAYRAEIPLRAYLMAVARSVACKALRKRHPTRSLEGVAELSRIPEGLPAEDAGQLRQAMERLEPRERLLLRLIYWMELDYAGAARILGVQPNTVGPMLSRAREALRAALK